MKSGKLGSINQVNNQLIYSRQTQSGGIFNVYLTRIKMLTIIKNLFQKLTSAVKQPSPLEAFIMSKNPKDIADVEHWARIYSHKNGGWIV